MPPPDIDAKVAFLSRTGAYPAPTRSVAVRETHMSWVFLTDTEAWKLKKPIRYDHIDLSTEDARRRNSETEIRLNRRLAPEVYLELLPLTAVPGGGMEIAGAGAPFDWLIRMRRLREDRMLDRMILDRTVHSGHAREIGGLLADFYQSEAPAVRTRAEYLDRLREAVISSRQQLERPEYGLPRRLVRQAAGHLLRSIDADGERFGKRAEAGRIIEAHGDLRPEHICLDGTPVIIDCLEFNRDLRILDAHSELAFLSLECERLGAPEIGGAVIEAYAAKAGDAASPSLTAFYMSYHAVLRAMVAVWHLRDDPILETEKWVRRACWFLRRSLNLDP